MRQAIILFVTICLALGLGWAIQPSRAIGAHDTKKVCKTVTKKVHGKKKKVKVCHAVRVAPKPTATGTSTPRPTDTPTPTATPTSTPRPTAVPAPRLEYSGTSLIDTYTSVSASEQKLQAGQKNNYTLAPSPGAVFLWVLASETNRSSVPFVSSYFNFELQDKNSGVVYQLQNGTPYGATENIMPVLTLNSGQTNVGWMEASIPDQPATYYVMWNESGAIPWTPIVHFDYHPGVFARAGSAVTVRPDK